MCEGSGLLAWGYGPFEGGRKMPLPSQAQVHALSGAGEGPAPWVQEQACLGVQLQRPPTP